MRNCEGFPLHKKINSGGQARLTFLGMLTIKQFSLLNQFQARLCSTVRINNISNTVSIVTVVSS